MIYAKKTADGGPNQATTYDFGGANIALSPGTHRTFLLPNGDVLGIITEQEWDAAKASVRNLLQGDCSRMTADEIADDTLETILSALFGDGTLKAPSDGGDNG